VRYVIGGSPTTATYLVSHPKFFGVEQTMPRMTKRENDDCCKHETIHLLKRNSRRAAEAVRVFTDEQLDTAASVSLNAGAPLTAQFIIEDHALRHSWHHLAKIKTALKEFRPATRRPMLVGV
jgi:hypothetical protein